MALRGGVAVYISRLILHLHFFIYISPSSSYKTRALLHLRGLS